MPWKSPAARFTLPWLIAVWLSSLSVSSVHAQAQAQGSVTPPESAAVPHPGDATESRSDLLISGIAALGATYVLTLGVDFLERSVYRDDCDRGLITRGCHDDTLMLIPVVGPLLTEDKNFKTLNLFMSFTQITSVVITLAGVYKYMDTDRSRNFWVYAGPLNGGGFAATRVSF